MTSVLVTGSADGIGRETARTLIRMGHRVVVHARSSDRAAEVRNAIPDAAEVVVGDLASLEEARDLAAAAGRHGPYDAVIHNAGVGPREPRRIGTADGLSHVFAINVLAPYLLTALITPPDRLVYLSSGTHRGGQPDFADLQWSHRAWAGSQAYADSKLLDVVLCFAVARLWPDVLSNAVEPGWVPTRMGGPGAPDDISLAPVTQAWLATSDDPAAMVSGLYFYHQRLRETHPATRSHAVQGQLLAACAELTGVGLPGLSPGNAAG
jgi:NAD(P)-dependent dehydrogenase (short-subunit alcohol dehydrogenase family)